MKHQILIIGAGWYGCHLGLYLKEKGHKIRIYEKSNRIFNGSSGKNQFRVHQGYHYPRSSKTIKEIKKNFKNFLKTYGKFIKFPKDNIYCIAKNKSLIDFGTYINILKSNNLTYKKIKIDFLKNIDGSVLIKEGVLQNSKIIDFFKKKIGKEILFNKEIKDIKKISKSFDYVIDCTNNTMQNNFKKVIKYILTISFVYKKRVGAKAFPVTIMDGKLPSIYPYADKKDYFTLTHSKYTHIKKFKSYFQLKNYQKKMNKIIIRKQQKLAENSIMKFYSNFKEIFLYKGHFFSYKVLPNGKTDDRPTFYNRDGNVISFFSGKIGNIFSAESIVNDLINGKK
tara:strand:+ start:497 stop:1510 length:1014 start_codon:yes stop_codon:yes gene_type:complete